MLAAHHVAGLTMGEADDLRQALAGGEAGRLAAWRERFVEGAGAQGWGPEDARQVWGLLCTFGGFCFNKAHSAACATTIARSAYAKAHYPAEFYAALLTSEMGYYGLAHYAEDAKRNGLRLLPPDVNRSEYEFTVEIGSESTGPWMLSDDPEQTPVRGGVAVEGAPALRTGLAVVQGVGPTGISAIIRERRCSGAFCSLADFCTRADLSVVTRPAIENLIRCGCFDWTGYNRPQLLAGLPSAMAAAKAEGHASASQLPLLPDQELPLEELEPGAIPLPPFSTHEAMVDERRLLGFFVTHHPLEHHRQTLAQRGAITCAAAKAARPGSRATVAGVVASVRSQRTRRGDRMLFVLLEDTTASLEVVILPDLYRQFREVLAEDATVLATGRLEIGDEQPRLLARSVEWLPADEQLARDEVVGPPARAGLVAASG